MPTGKISGQLTVNCTRRGILSHAETKKLTQNQQNKETQGYNYQGQQHKVRLRHNTRRVNFQTWPNEAYITQKLRPSGKQSQAVGVGCRSSRGGSFVQQRRVSRLLDQVVTSLPSTRALEWSLSRREVSSSGIEESLTSAQVYCTWRRSSHEPSTIFKKSVFRGTNPVICHQLTRVSIISTFVGEFVKRRHRPNPFPYTSAQPLVSLD